MSRVWADQTITNQTELLVLLAIADYANGDGIAWPSVESIALKARLYPRSVFRVLDRLKKTGKLRIESGGGKQTNHYKITLSTASVSVSTPPPPKTPHVPEAVTVRQGTPVFGVPSKTPDPSGTVIDPKKRKDKIASLSPSAVFDEWNSKANQLPKCRQLSDKRSHSLKARLRDPFFCEHWISAITRIHDSSFCCGSNNRGWKADFDWFIQPDTVVRIMEGKYDNNNPVAGVKSSLTAQIARDVLR